MCSLSAYAFNEMVTHFNMILEQGEVLRSNLTATQIKKKEFPCVWPMKKIRSAREGQ